MTQFTQLEIELLYKLALDLCSNFYYDKAIERYYLNKPVRLTKYSIELIKKFLEENVEDPKLQELKNNTSVIICFKNFNKTIMINLIFETYFLILTRNEYNLLKTLKNLKI